MNLVQLANDLEFVPKEQLAQMSQDPNSRFPSYLVLSEIQRRTMNEKAYAAAQAPPTTTVAEEVVGEFMQPQGMQAGMPPESAPTDVFSSGMSGMPASAPMQQPMQMASGGSTSYFEGGPTNLTDQQYYSGGLRDFNDRLRNQSRIDAAQTSAQTAVTEGLDAAGQPVMSSQLVNQNLEPDEMEMEMGMASGGLTGYATGNRTSLSSSFADPYSNVGGAIGTSSNPYGDAETENKVIEFVKENPWATGLNAAALIALVTPVPGGRIASGALAGLSKAIQYGPKAIRGLKGLYNKGLSKLGAGQARKDIAGGKLLPEFSSGTRNVPTPPNFYQNLGRDRLSNMRLGQRTLGAGTLATGIGYAYNEMDENNTQNNNQTELSQADKDFNKQMQANILANQQAQLDQNALDQKKANRMFSPTDLIQLGGTVMGARDMSELGQGIAGVAGLSAQRKADEKQAGLQARYLQAQTEKIEADIASMPLKDALATVKQIDLFFKALAEGSRDATDAEVQEAVQTRQFLMQKIAEEQGFDSSMIAGNNKNVIASYAT